MGLIEGFGFKIFRLKDEKPECEFLLFNEKKKVFNQYNRTRLTEILIKEIGRDKFIQLYKKIMDEEKKLVKSKDLIQFIENDIDEEYVLLDNINYKPTNILTFYDNESKKEYFNIYLAPRLKFEEGTYKNISEVIYNLCDNNVEQYTYICKWLAWIITHPLDRIPTALIFQGVQGSGKTAFTDLVLKPLFETNMRYINQVDIDSDFNDFMFGVQLIIANEVIHNDNKMVVSDKLKNYVADNNIPLKRKFKNTLNIKNYCNFIFQTNNMLPLRMDADDRRYSVFKSSNKIDIKIVKILEKQCKDETFEEVKAFLYYLLTLEVNKDEVLRPIFTDAKKEILEASFNSVQEFMKELYEDLNGDLRNHNLICLNNSKTMSFIPLKEFYDKYVIFCFQNGYKHNFSRSKFTRELKKHYGLDIDIQKYQGETTRVVVVRRLEVITNEN